MGTDGFKKWITIAALAVAPLAFAQSSGAMDGAQQDSVDTVLATAPAKSSEDQQIDALRKELDGLHSELSAQREREDTREQVLGDPDSHPLWP